MIETEIKYPLNDSLTARGFIAYDESKSPQPLVMVAPDWRGRSDFYCDIARKLATLGYVGFALDMYGDAILGVELEDKKILLEPLRQNRAELLKRMQAAFEFGVNQRFVNKSKVAALGYCFGGMCVLDLARSGASLNGIVSLHGLLAAPNLPDATIKSKVLVLHGYEDTYVKPPQVLEFADEMTRKKADWQIQLYGHTSHSFTKPGADDPTLGLKYDATANQRSWDAALYFLKEVFK